MMAREVDTAQARVVFDPPRAAEQQQHDLATLWPTHILQTRGGRRYLVDVGLAKHSPTEPLSLNSSDVESTVARGVLSKQFKLRPATDSPHSEDATQGYYLQVSILDAAEGAEPRWQDYLFFQDSSGRTSDDFIQTWVAMSPQSVSTQCPFAPMPVKGVGQVSVHDEELVLRKQTGDPDAKNGYIFLEGTGRTMATREKLNGPQAVADAMAKYFDIPSTYMEGLRVPVKVKAENAW